ncbi:hypothetical protein BaOVIS_025800 [Babesia ovis]|uniref:Uncharacterized protein n=1 Tax=Babesia ovis TaxID=5869 RepID=A0A9W5TD45_BABOV|nr:hypothetical protein BaOVIS_025800 [Babesia ovis]
MKHSSSAAGNADPVRNSVGFDTGMKDLDPAKRSALLKDVKYGVPGKSKRDVLQGLQQEARELLSLTYELKMDQDNTAATVDHHDVQEFKTHPLLKTPNLDINHQTRHSVESKWFHEDSKNCKLINGLTKGTGTEKILDLHLSDNARESVVGNITSTDVLEPITHLDKGLSYPLDLSSKDIQNNAPPAIAATREGYREMLVSLQQKYNVVLRMFEEINEQRMSYIEGMQELQGHLDNARSVMQLQKAEIDRLSSRAEYHESVAHQVANDLQRCNEALSERMRQEAELVNEIQEKQARIERLEADMAEQQLSVDSLTKRLEKAQFMPAISDNAEFKDCEYTYNQAIKALWDLVSKLGDSTLEELELEKLTTNAEETASLRYLETLFNMPLTSQLLTIYRQRFAIESRFQNDVRQLREANDREIELTNERAKQLIDTYAARAMKADAENMTVRSFLQTLLQRQTMRTSGKVMARISKQLRIPTAVMLLEKSVIGRPYFRNTCVRVVGDDLQIGRVKGDNFSIKTTIDIKDIFKIDFGFNSTSYILYNTLVVNKYIYPWQFFTIVTKSKEYHFICENDHLLDVLIIGLNLKIFPHRFNVGVVDISQLRMLKAKTKMHYHCMKNNISHRRMWLNAIKKTIAERQQEN